ncbi:Hypothetical predicted protein [Octopus vulgaris]|uniref:Uncharacterized protein n=1 Tax=Octopus vulgaris TaxID=6645 RepID=A0AA36F2H8_OCTVU|nr:Hypothetical predicted protein [Octopus vulgaris]
MLKYSIRTRIFYKVYYKYSVQTEYKTTWYPRETFSSCEHNHCLIIRSNIFGTTSQSGNYAAAIFEMLLRKIYARHFREIYVKVLSFDINMRRQ